MNSVLRISNYISGRQNDSPGLVESGQTVWEFAEGDVDGARQCSFGEFSGLSYVDELAGGSDDFLVVVNGCVGVGHVTRPLG